MPTIGIGGMSAKQLSRLRNGHRVRVGSGLGSLVVNPERFDSMSKSFKKGKNTTIQLSPEELSSNRELSGEGIFGKSFDKFLKKHGIKDVAYKLGDIAKPHVKKAIKTLAKGAPNAFGTAAAALATYAGRPDLAPAALAAGKKVGQKATDYTEKHLLGYIDDPDAYQKNPRKKLLGFGMGGDGLYAGGRGLYAGGRGLYASGRGVVGGDGLYAGARGRGMLGGGHPAMASQALDSLYQQRFHLGGRGLYL